MIHEELFILGNCITFLLEVLDHLLFQEVAHACLGHGAFQVFGELIKGGGKAIPLELVTASHGPGLDVGHGFQSVPLDSVVQGCQSRWRGPPKAQVISIIKLIKVNGPGP